MRSAWNLPIVPACILAAVLLASCGGGGDCNGGGATAPCPDPTYGWARVNGSALTDDGTPIPDARVRFACADYAASNDSHTDAEGRFSVFLTYAVADTLRQPFPPRQPDGSFTVTCEASLITLGDILHPGGSFEIPFGPTQTAIVESEVEVRLPSESPAT